MGAGDTGGCWGQGWVQGTEMGAGDRDGRCVLVPLSHAGCQPCCQPGTGHRTVPSPSKAPGGGVTASRTVLVPLWVPWWDSPAQPGPPTLGRIHEVPLQTPPSPEVTPSTQLLPPAAPGWCQRSFCPPGAAGRCWRCGQEGAAGAGITAGRKRCSVSPANVLIPFNSHPWTRPRGHQPSPGTQGSSQPPSLEPFWRKASKGAQNVGKEHLEALLPSVVLSAQLSRQQPCQAAGASLPAAASSCQAWERTRGAAGGFVGAQGSCSAAGMAADVRAVVPGQVPGRRQLRLPGLVPAQLSLPGSPGCSGTSGVTDGGGRGTATLNGMWHP